MQNQQLIRQLAEQYETAEFLQGDPSWFMHQVCGQDNRETMAFIASCFSFGARKQFMQKIQMLLEFSANQPHEWISSGKFLSDIPANDACFYRMYTNNMVRSTFMRLRQMFDNYGSIKNFIRSKGKAMESEQSQDPMESEQSKNNPIESESSEKLTALSVLTLLVDYFADSGGIIPRNTQSACKRLCMFLRWMVRDNSPVDLGLWSDIIDQRTLIMPMDTHVMQQSRRLGILEAKTASMTTARKLSAEMLKIFPDDPLKADFALFGYGVNNQAQGL